MPGFFSKFKCCCKKRNMEPEDKKPPEPPPPEEEPTAPPEPAAEAPPANVDADKKPPPTSAETKPPLDPTIYGNICADKLRDLQDYRDMFVGRFIRKLNNILRYHTGFTSYPLSTTLITYSCPICNHEQSGVKAWTHFEKCMLNKLRTDPCGYAVLCVVSLNPPEQAGLCKNILVKYLRNITTYPHEELFRKLTVKSELFYESVFPIVGGLSIFEVAGYKLLVKMVDNLPQVYLELPKNVDTTAANIVANWLEVARPIRPIIKRNMKLIEPTEEEKQKYLEPAQLEEAPEGVGSTSTATGWADFAQMDHRMARIYFEITPNKGIEASFIVTETSCDLYNFIEPLFQPHEKELVLMKVDNTKLTRDCTTVLTSNLAPNAIVFIKWEPSGGEEDEKLGLKFLLYNDK